jgi:hypothetical protein
MKDGQLIWRLCEDDRRLSSLKKELQNKDKFVTVMFDRIKDYEVMLHFGKINLRCKALFTFRN